MSHCSVGKYVFEKKPSSLYPHAVGNCKVRVLVPKWRGSNLLFLSFDHLQKSINKVFASKRCLISKFNFI